MSEADWISVKEGVPAANGDYLVTWGIGRVGIAFWEQKSFYEATGTWYAWDSGKEEYSIVTLPTHWMKLPKAPATP